MKKKILSLALVVAMIAVMMASFTLAYFTDTDTETNVFTMGDVEIELVEEFEQNAELFPGEKNAVEKVVTVKNTGSEDAYMWIELWIPAELDVPGNAAANSLHFNPFNTYKDKDGNIVLCRMSVAEKEDYELVAETVEVELEAKEIDGVLYNGYREYIKDDTRKVTGDSTAALLARVFMDQNVEQCTDDSHEDNCLVLKSGKHYTGSWEIIVNAYGIQAEGFANIEEAIAAYDGDVL